MAHVAQWKKDYVNTLVTNIMEKPVIGVVNISGIPARQMQMMRENIRELMVLKGSKNTLIKLALETAASQGKTNVESLFEFVDGQCAIVATDLNPFKLFKKFEGTMTATPAKGGETAPEDIVVKKGPTQFKPGPLVSEFSKAGLPAAIDKGKIVIKKNTTIVKKGDVISRDVAGALTKLEIFPLTVGLDLKSAWDDGTIFDSDALKVDEDQIMAQFKLASAQALNLAVFAGITTPKTIVPIIQKAFNQAIALSVSSGFPTAESIKLMVARAQGQMMALASLLSSEALDPEIQDLLSSTPVAAPAPSAGKETTEEAEPEEEEEEEVSEEEAAAGLGALFG